MEILEVFKNVLNPESMFLTLVGVAMGNIFGCIPGLNTPIAVALILPFTLVMDPVPSICLIMGIYMGGVSGGLVSAILLRIPGTAASVATTFDGYPMTLKGRGTEALTLGAFASVFGGIFSTVMLFLLAPLLCKLAISFGPWEYFGSALLALSLVCVLIKGNLVKGYIAMAIGLLIKCVGISPIDGIASRFTFGSYHMDNGFNLIAVVIGVFALSEILNNMGKLNVVVHISEVRKKFFYMLPPKDIRRHLGNMLRSSIIGTVIGILPGMGGGPAGMIAYAQAKKFSKRSEEFGHGCDEGVAASESANNATTGGALIPMLALGVPGDTTTAIILGAFMMQGIPTGPELSLNQPILFRTIIFTVLVANIFMFLFQASTLRFMAKIIRIPRIYLMPLITVFCITGIICLNNNIFDVYYTLGFIILGYILDKNGYPIAPLILGVVLGGIIEENLRRSIVYYQSFFNCIQRISIGTLFFWIAVLLPIVSALLANKKACRALHIKERNK